MQTVITVIKEYLESVPLGVAIIFLTLCAMIVYCILMLIGLTIFWMVDDIIDAPNKKKRREEIDRLKAELEKSNQDRKEAPIIEMLLYDDLKAYCTDQLIPLKYGEEYFKTRAQSAAGYISYLIDKREEKAFGYQIFIKRHDDLDENKTNVWTLAHELGHFRSIADHKDHSEEGADYEARKLCESLLTQKDLDNVYFDIALRCHTMTLEEMEKFKHIENLMEDA